MGIINRWLKAFQRPVAPTPEPIKIAGIYTCCHRLGLSKSFQLGSLGLKMVVAMQSGRDAVYELTDWQSASGVDWDWHIFTFKKWAYDTDAASLPRYC